MPSKSEPWGRGQFCKFGQFWLYVLCIVFGYVCGRYMMMDDMYVYDMCMYVHSEN